MSWIGRIRLAWLNRRLRKEGKVTIPFDGILWEVQLWKRNPEPEPEWVFRPERKETES